MLFLFKKRRGAGSPSFGCFFKKGRYVRSVAASRRCRATHFAVGPFNAEAPGRRVRMLSFSRTFDLSRRPGDPALQRCVFAVAPFNAEAPGPQFGCFPLKNAEAPGRRVGMLSFSRTFDLSRRPGDPALQRCVFAVAPFNAEAPGRRVRMLSFLRTFDPSRRPGDPALQRCVFAVAPFNAEAPGPQFGYFPLRNAEAPGRRVRMLSFSRTFDLSRRPGDPALQRCVFAGPRSPPRRRAVEFGCFPSREFDLSWRPGDPALQRCVFAVAPFNAEAPGRRVRMHSFLRTFDPSRRPGDPALQRCVVAVAPFNAEAPGPQFGYFP